MYGRESFKTRWFSENENFSLRSMRIRREGFSTWVRANIRQVGTLKKVLFLILWRQEFQSLNSRDSILHNGNFHAKYDFILWLYSTIIYIYICCRMQDALVHRSLKVVHCTMYSVHPSTISNNLSNEFRAENSQRDYNAAKRKERCNTFLFYC